MDAVHQCPHCDLRFERRTELEDHLRVEHGDRVGDEVEDDTRDLDG